MKKVISYIFVVLLLVSCEKSKNKSLTIEGRLMSGCNTPAANKEGSIRTYDGLLTGSGLVLDFTTDDKGYFKINHNEKGSISKFYVNVEGASDVLRVHYYPEDHKKLGEIYTFPPSTSYYLYLEVDSAYTEFDTLTYSNGGSPFDGRPAWLKIPGPFSSQIIDTVDYAVNPTVMPISFDSYESGDFSKFSVHYYMNEYEYSKEKQISISTPYCLDEYQEVALKIE